MQPCPWGSQHLGARRPAILLDPAPMVPGDISIGADGTGTWELPEPARDGTGGSGGRRGPRRDNPVAGRVFEVPVRPAVVHQAEAEVAPPSVSQEILTRVERILALCSGSSSTAKIRPEPCAVSSFKQLNRGLKLPPIAPLPVLPSRTLGKTFPDPDRILTIESLTRNCFLFLPKR